MAQDTFSFGHVDGAPKDKETPRPRKEEKKTQKKGKNYSEMLLRTYIH